MYGLSSRGLGATQAYCDAMKQQKTVLGTGTYPPSCVWAAIFGYDPPTTGVAPAPPVDLWTVPPASGADAQATVDALANQQLVDQQAANAGNVQGSWWDTLTGGTYSAAVGAASGLTSALPWLLGGLGLVAFAFVAAGSGSARRYGR
jgi:hypothetical protein